MNDQTNQRISRLRRAAFYARIVTALVLLTMFVGTHIPMEIHTPPELMLDKVYHLLAFMALAICALASWELSVGILQPQHYFVVWLFGTLYGLFDELTQVPVGRTCEGADWLADVVGIVVGLIVFRLSRPFLYRRI